MRVSTSHLRYVLLTTLLLTSIFVSAQRNSHWIEGKVTFKNGETQYRMLNYDATVSEGLLQLREDDKVLTYSVKEVDEFSFFDDDAGQWRRFYALPLYLVQGDVTRTFFMELVYSGSKWSVLRKKERWVGPYTYQLLSPESYVIQQPINKIRFARYYEISYLLNMENGEIEELSKESLLTSVDDQRKPIRKFIKEHRLKLDVDEDCVYLLEYYHYLLTAPAATSDVTVAPTE